MCFLMCVRLTVYVMQNELVFIDTYLKTMALLTEKILCGNFHILKKYLCCVATFDTHFFLRWSTGDTTKSSFDDKSSHFVLYFPCFRILNGHLCKNGHDVGDTTVRYPNFTTIKNIMRAVRGFDSTGTYGVGVGTRTWLSQAEGGILAIADSGQVLGFLFGSTVQKYALK